jgi:hypothetical protein
MNTRQPKSATSFVARKRWDSNTSRDRSNGSQNAQKSYERYLALAEAQVRAGDIVGAENYYQYAEHYLRSMSSNPGTI